MVEIIEEKLKEISEDENNKYTIQELVLSFISLVNILIEITVSPIQDILIANEVEI